MNKIQNCESKNELKSPNAYYMKGPTMISVLFIALKIWIYNELW